MARQMELTSPQVSVYLLGICDHYIMNKFVSIHLQTFEFYLMQEWANLYRFSNKIIETDVGSDDESNTEDKRITIYYGKYLCNICLYDYAFVIKKVLINAHELSMLLGQKNRSQVDRFLFREDNEDNIYVPDEIHPQCKSHIQLYRQKGSKRVVILYKTVQDLREDYNTWTKACSKETELNQKLQKNILKEPILAKACHIDCCVSGYDTVDELDISDDDNNLAMNDSPNNTIL
ncbi:17010_t:CDS:2 [Cetraspora pellucida]|uniref:17010_t:CDS:1 n=1 Tax=Cetraspora pellucida TaxID=1433469 RepID=A0A9N9JRB1_9GLOM|nr:17010_t:CDS:2 [Cetraspora pellucida]